MKRVKISPIEGKIDCSKDKEPTKVKISNGTYPTWYLEVINYSVYNNKSVPEMTVLLNRSTSAIQHVMDLDDVRREIKRLKEERLKEVKDRLMNLANSAMTTLEALITTADSDSVRLKAAMTVLKELRIIEDISNVNLSGSVQFPTINIVTTVKPTIEPIKKSKGRPKKVIASDE